MNTKTIVNGAILSAIYIALLFAYTYLPIISLVAAFSLPVPIIVFAAKNTWQKSLICALSMFILSLLLGNILIIIQSFSMIFIGYIYGISFKKLSTSYLVVITSLATLITMILSMVIMGSLYDYNMIDDLYQMIEQVKTLLLSQKNTNEMQVNDIVTMITNLIPIIIALTSLLNGFITHLIARNVLSRLKLYQMPRVNISEITFSRFFGIGFLMVIMTNLIVATNPGVVFEEYLILVLNIQALLMIFVCIQGFSTLIFYFNKAQINGGMVVAILSIFVFPYALIFIGLIDNIGKIKEKILIKQNQIPTKI